MDLKQVMAYRNFVVLGNTVKSDRYAAMIKKGLEDKGYRVAGVGRELNSINDVPFEIDIIDLCINAKEGLRLLKENTKPFKEIVIQPGASDEALINWLDENNVPYINSCLLTGLSLYSRNN
ncbi:MAG: CoA-binding protein [Treponema sp.]|jgi:predicted CoA-binding protein|nr:CoA-binding protein [Treponema sp.]